MKKRNRVFITIMLVLFMTAGIFTYIAYAKQKREAALKKAETEAKAKAALDIQTAPPDLEIKELENLAKQPEEPKRAEPVKNKQQKTSVKTASATRTSTLSRGTKPVRKSRNGVSEADRELFYRLVSAEAAGESFDGKLAIATIVMNRVKSPNYPNTIRGVIYDKNWGYQFTPVLDGRINLPPTSESKKAVNMILNGYRSFEPKVLYFMNPEKSTNRWIIQNKTYFKTIGNHKFYY